MKSKKVKFLSEKTFRQSRGEERTGKGLAGELGALGILRALGLLFFFCAGVRDEMTIRQKLSLPALSQYSQYS